jgi:hypothetical protein
LNDQNFSVELVELDAGDRESARTIDYGERADFV